LDLANIVAQLDISLTPTNDLPEPQQLQMTMLQKDVEPILATMAEAEMAGRRSKRRSEAKTKSANSDLGSTQFDCATLWQPLLNSPRSPANLEINAIALMI
jgi:hypothetical protein